MPTFTPPLAYDEPPDLPGTRGPAFRLFRFFPNRPRFVAIYALSDGTYAQDTGTDEKWGTDIPLPWNPNDPSGPYTDTSYVDYSLSPPKVVTTTTSHNPFITKVYLGPTPISTYEAQQLTAGGYGDHIT